MDDLVGTCGGYIGLFLGYALIQFPRLVENMFDSMKHKIFSRDSKQIIEYEYERNREIEELPENNLEVLL